MNGGYIHLLEIQLAGKKRMEIKAVLNGFDFSKKLLSPKARTRFAFSELNWSVAKRIDSNKLFDSIDLSLNESVSYRLLLLQQPMK